MTSIASAQQRTSSPRDAVRVKRGPDWRSRCCSSPALRSSNPPADNASNARWIANYTGSSEQARHLLTGVLLVLAGLCLAAFFTALWRRIREVTPSLSPLPLVAAASSAACIAAGGVVMAFVSGGELLGKYPLPSAEVLRLSNDLGFALVGVAGMLAASLAVVCLNIQANAAGVIGRKTYVFGVIVAIALLFGMLFVPVIAPGRVGAAVAIQWMRSGR